MFGRKKRKTERTKERKKSEMSVRSMKKNKIENEMNEGDYNNNQTKNEHDAVKQLEVVVEKMKKNARKKLFVKLN